jgi:hypothetical protein
MINNKPYLICAYRTLEAAEKGLERFSEDRNREDFALHLVTLHDE